MVEFDKGLMARGSWGKLQKCMKKAAAGQPITLAFLGGSITQGSLASIPENCYAYRVFKWWQETFPGSNMTFVNAGIGGTTSQFGVARVGEDVLSYRPDFVLMEFSVNDENTPHFRETYEGLVRRLLSSGTALMLMNNVCYDSGYSAEEMHLQVAQHYNLPSVSMKSTLYAALLRGELINRDITPDDLHPNDLGHELVAKVITHFLEQVRSAPWETVREDPLPAPLTANRYEGSQRYQAHNSTPVLGGFRKDTAPQHHITEIFRKGFTAWEKGATATFSVKGTCIGVQYRKSVIQPTPIARITVDGEHAMLLDGNFRETWGDCLYLDTVAEGLDNKEHTVTVELVETHEDDKVPFYLVSVIGS